MEYISQNYFKVKARVAFSLDKEIIILPSNHDNSLKSDGALESIYTI